ncbi:hypothetical protein So717_07820 [Roseobacter cerasinus]|uniref:HTH cro/C1-type domain-containing protein n=1 Tax=Roseobacter cerasinus TaxID=2602289 RepID=A0A640VLR8_9RHOB|nr:helix-turn-helix domain-containing protein [Roseobacter cerasinus]GFE49029.1 hypothetical protein So717_07820 [Roseobacter cerasinus]
MKHIDIAVDRERHAHIKYQLELRGLSLAEIAEQIGVGASAVSSVSLGKSRSKRIEQALAAALDKTPEELFPERYQDLAEPREVPR